MKNYLQYLLSSPLWITLLGLFTFPYDVTGINSLAINVSEKWILHNLTNKTDLLEITCEGERPIRWNILTKDWSKEDYYSIKENSSSFGYSSILTIADPYTGKLTCVQETGDSVTSYAYKHGRLRGNIKVTIGNMKLLDWKKIHQNITVNVFKYQNEDISNEFRIDNANIFEKTRRVVRESGTASKLEDPTCNEKEKPLLHIPGISYHYNSHFTVGIDFILNCSFSTYGHTDKMKIEWIGLKLHNNVKITTYMSDCDLLSVLKVTNPSSDNTGIYTCISSLKNKTKNVTKEIVISETLEAFVEIENKTRELTEVSLEEQETFWWEVKFRAFPDNLTHYFMGPSRTYLTDDDERFSTSFNYKEGVANLWIKNITAQDFGNYTFVLKTWNGKSDNTSMTIYVNAPPKINFINISESYSSNAPVSLNASILSYNNVSSNYSPDIDCYFVKNCRGETDTCDDTEPRNLSQYINTKKLGFGKTNNFSTTIIFETGISGKIRCNVSNDFGSNSIDADIIITAVPKRQWLAIIGFIVIIICLGSVIFFLVLHIKKKNKLNEELQRNKISFHECEKERDFDPEITVYEKYLLRILPYDESYEVERTRITFSKKLLGSGHFGIVKKAEVQCLEKNKKSSIVAVKMNKDRHNIPQLQTLEQELKIMIHLGKHLNIVNLMGAMTVDLDKGEIWILVEYCRYGDLLQFIRKNKSTFVNQIDPRTGVIETDRTSSQREKCRQKKPGYMPQKTSNSIFSNPKTNNSSASQPENLKGTPGYVTAAVGDQLNQSKKEHPTPSTAAASYVPPSQFLDHNSHHSDGYSEADSEWIPGISGPITTTDLICWMWQVANGMKYLADRKVIHGDLAARNILLAEKNVIKISDFGLSKNIHKNDIYKKKSEGDMPIRWMSLEAYLENIFSTQSDVWAYGITMWEIFTLGVNPYPGVPLDSNFTLMLQNGVRMKKPEFANKHLYDIMRNCWDANPMLRPKFNDLCDTLSPMLAPERKEDYATMNQVYMVSNDEYLSNMPSPDNEHTQFAEDKIEVTYIQVNGTMPASKHDKSSPGYMDMSTKLTTDKTPVSASVLKSVEMKQKTKSKCSLF